MLNIVSWFGIVYSAVANVTIGYRQEGVQRNFSKFISGLSGCRCYEYYRLCNIRLETLV
jgi:hypothetical protein